ncbi:helix-turn-helix domain-containing protein [Rhodobacter sp. CZR27]|uniref:helix-turn-helix domain-containing protein n=1 Tax=Rhodobacter sp. CZR27 TaxID=2033869 RepID=UPI000BBE9B19|nr:helix-turn-helix domain-containing protein [Rhodobacter sp. CZR27]
MIWRRTQPSTAEVDKPKGFDDFELRLGDLMRGERATLGKSLLDVQRELKIKATYIAAIENADVSAFETQGFIAGYVRSYARYLGMDPDWAFQRFCAEANFTTMHGMAVAVSSVRREPGARGAGTVRDPLADPNALFVPRGESLLSNIEPGAVGSVVVLLALIGGIGYGGWSVLQQVQRVQVAPVDQAPRVVAEVDPLGNVSGMAPLVRSAPEPAAVDVAEADPAQQPDLMGRLYRPRAQALDVPVLVSRDGPIASINPRASEVVQQASLAAMPATEAPAAVEEAAVQVAEAAPPTVELLAVRPSWVRVQAADGTVLFEKILDSGERYTVPQMEQPPVLRAGNSGSVYFAVNGQTYGPSAPGAQVVKNVALSPEALTGKYAVADLTGDADLARFVTVAQNETN